MGSRVPHGTLEEDRRTYRPKRCEYNNKDEVNRVNILSNNHYQTSSQKFRQIIVINYVLGAMLLELL